MPLMPRSVSQRRTLGKRKRTSTMTRRVKARSQSNINTTNRGTNPGSLVIHRGIGMPDRFRTKLVWSESIALSSFGTSITQSYGVGMNNPYDPQANVGGNQPAYFDTLASLYKYCGVMGSKMSVTFGLPTTATNGDGPYIVGIYSSNTNSLPTTDSPTLIAASNCVNTVLSQGTSTKTVTQVYSPRNNLGKSYDDQQLAVTAGASPTQQYYGIVFASPQGSSTTGSVNAIITIEYICEFYNLQATIDA